MPGRERERRAKETWRERQSGRWFTRDAWSAFRAGLLGFWVWRSPDNRGFTYRLNDATLTNAPHQWRLATLRSARAAIERTSATSKQRSPREESKRGHSSAASHSPSFYLPEMFSHPSEEYHGSCWKFLDFKAAANSRKDFTTGLPSVSTISPRTAASLGRKEWRTRMIDHHTCLSLNK